MDSAIRHSTVKIPDVHLKFMSVRIKEVGGIPFASIFPPFDNVMCAKAPEENVEIVFCDAERIVRIVRRRPGALVQVKREAKP